MTPFLNVLAANPLEHVVDAPLIQSGKWWILTNHMVMMLVAAGLMLLIFPAMTRHYRDGRHVPTGTRNFFEAILVYIRNDVVKPVLGDQTYKYISYIWTLFFFILFCNLLGLLPLDLLTGQTGLKWGHHGHGIFGTATSNFWVTATLALISFSVIQYSGLKANGLAGWLKHFLGGAPLYLAPLMVVVEFLSMLTKPFSLAVRLAANMTAGHILLAVIIGFVAMATAALGKGGGLLVGIPSVVAAVGIMVLELFVACLQAYLFMFLTTLFIGQMITHHEHGDNHHDRHDAHGHEGEPTYPVGNVEPSH